jgi:hypothetical protein
MRKTAQRLTLALAVGVFAFGTAAPAFAGGEPPPEQVKCNSGRGNLSETTPATDCDPGNSGGHNNGGD